MDIFNFIYENDNNCLYKMNKKDKIELLNLLKLYTISYRDKLNLKDNITFGLELEFGTTNPIKLNSEIKSHVYRNILSNNKKDINWIFKEETSFFDGYEINSSILTDKKESWDELKEICDLLKMYKVVIDERCAGHIHFGTQIIEHETEYWMNFFRLYCAYENIIYRFSYGEFENKRSYINMYAYPVFESFINKLDKLDKDIDLPSLKKLLREMNPGYKKYGIALYKVSEGGTSYEVNRTIEFRMPNASIEQVIWQNNVNFFAHLLDSCNKKMDIDYLKDKINKKRDILGNLNYYNMIDIDEALELSDLIFDTNIDKINFLREYLKEFETHNTFRHSDTFIKR